MSTASAKLHLPGISRAIRDINARIHELALRPGETVFLTGEPGTEKALAARLLHQLSERRDKNFVRIVANWKLPADFSDQLRLAKGGTVFLNLVREFPVEMQYTLLEIALDQTFTDPMSDETVEAGVRLILTTSLSSEVLFERSTILPDLREMMGRSHIDVPPLRQRREDIPLLVRFALQRARDSGHSEAEAVDRQVLGLFRGYTWPGNAEQLLLVAAQAALKANSPLVTLDDLPEDFIALVPPPLVRQVRQIDPGRQRLPPKTPIPHLHPLEDEYDEEREAETDGSRPPTPPRRPSDTPKPHIPRPATPPPPPPPRVLDPKEALARALEEFPLLDDPETLLAMGKEPSSLAPTPAPFDLRYPQEHAPPPPQRPASDVATARATPPPVEPTRKFTPLPKPAMPAATAPPAPPPPPPLPEDAEVMNLAQKLFAQAALLSRQMQGPLPPSNVMAREIAMTRGKGMGLGESPEVELARGLEQILALRRQLAILNQREQDSAQTIRDLLQRIEMEIESPESLEAQDLSIYLAEIDKIIERITDRLPRISEDIQQSIRRLLGKKRQG